MTKAKTPWMPTPCHTSAFCAKFSEPASKLSPRARALHALKAKRAETAAYMSMVSLYGGTPTMEKK